MAKSDRWNPDLVTIFDICVHLYVDWATVHSERARVWTFAHRSCCVDKLPCLVHLCNKADFEFKLA